MKKYFKTAMAFFLSAAMFFCCSYLYLNNSLKNERQADKKQQNIPYSETPENCGLHFLLPAGRELLFFLDFEQEISYIIDINKNTTYKNDYAGYSADYNFTLDYSVLSDIFDRLGGLDLVIENEELRFTGIQVCDLMCKNTGDDLSLKIVTAVCARLAENGFSGDDFVYLIENSDTDLKMPVCIYWEDRIKSIFSNAVFVNWEI